MTDLTRFRDYCRKQAKCDHPATEIALWILLADEVDDYLQREDDEPAGPTDDDTPLFEETTTTNLATPDQTGAQA